MLERPTSRVRRRQVARERHARYRARVKAGKMIALVELDGTALDWLVRIHWLTPEEGDRGDARVIGAAIARGLAASARG